MKLSAILTLLGATIGSAGAAPAPACALTLPPLTGEQTTGATQAPVQAPGVLLVDGDDDEGGWLFFGRGHDDDDDDDDEDDEDDDCDDDDDDEAGCGGKGGSNAAPAGSVAPPKNGLFGDGKPPAVKTN